MLARTSSGQTVGRHPLAWVNVQGPAVPFRRFAKSPQIIQYNALRAAEQRGKRVLTQAAIGLSKSFLQEPLGCQIPNYVGMASVCQAGAKFYRMDEMFPRFVPQIPKGRDVAKHRMRLSESWVQFQRPPGHRFTLRDYLPRIGQSQDR